MLRTENIYKKYGDYTALNDVSLEVPRGSIFGLLGAGKTSLIRIINQIVMPDAGRVFFDGEPLQPKHTAQIGYLPEERGLYKTMKVGEQALYLAQLKGLPKEEAKKQLKFWFERLEIGDWWNKKIQELLRKYNLWLRCFTSLNCLFLMSLLVVSTLSMPILSKMKYSICAIRGLRLSSLLTEWNR